MAGVIIEEEVRDVKPDIATLRRNLPQVRTASGVKVFLPPGRTTNMSEWNKEDVFRWMACFLPPNLHPNVYIPLKFLEFDGEVLQSVCKRRPSADTFGVPQKEFELIIQYGEAVLDYERQDVELVTLD